MRQTALGKLYGEHSEESIGVFRRPAEEIAYDKPIISVLRAQK